MSNIMNKQDLIEAMAAAADISKAAAENALNSLTDCITDTLSKGGKVAIANFGGWETSQRAARTGRNPQTGEAIKIAAATVARFKVGKRLKDAVNNG